MDAYFQAGAKKDSEGLYSLKTAGYKKNHTLQEQTGVVEKNRDDYEEFSTLSTTDFRKKSQGSRSKSCLIYDGRVTYRNGDVSTVNARLLSEGKGLKVDSVLVTHDTKRLRSFNQSPNSYIKHDCVSQTN